MYQAGLFQCPAESFWLVMHVALGGGGFIMLLTAARCFRRGERGNECAGKGNEWSVVCVCVKVSSVLILPSLEMSYSVAASLGRLKCFVNVCFVG